MIQHIPFGSTPKLKNIAYDITQEAIDKFQRENKKEYEDEPLDLPTITFYGTEKVHGTNAAVCFNTVDGLWVQSKNNVIKVGDDNFGCASWVEDNEPEWLYVIAYMSSLYSLDLSKHTLTIYFEFAGGGIQGDDSAVSGKDKSAFIFAHARVTLDGEHVMWLDTKGVSSDNAGIYNILDYGTYNVPINFNDIEYASEILNRITFETVEPKSPLGAAFDLDNVGEGVYYTAIIGTELVRFKHKGTLHGGKPKEKRVQSPDDDARVIFLNDLADKLTPTWRIRQAITDNNCNTMKDFGTLIKAVSEDIIKEEVLELAEHNVDYAEVHRYVVPIIKRYYTDTIGV